MNLDAWLDYAILAASAFALLVTLDVVRRMTAATHEPYRAAMILVCVGVFGQATLMLWRLECVAPTAGLVSKGALMGGLVALVLTDRRRRPVWGHPAEGGRR